MWSLFKHSWWWRSRTIEEVHGGRWSETKVPAYEVVVWRVEAIKMAEGKCLVWEKMKMILSKDEERLSWCICELWARVIIGVCFF